ncbi:hypothetical protein Y032_0002g1104 [Ancylostoma ceylanicum]|uniref:Phosphoserine phosphatase n=1 Tax=Ancylostoma ceylanicum TaxID=53326 RepID=A0A016VZG9_9BILA|nr:hypothetical protein Y032_0002g1104 [Ancylostoma ceylanicum]
MIRVAARPAATALSAHAECHTAHIETPEERTRRIWRSADAVAFDVDSTVCQDEAIDELANYLGVGEAVANVTRQAMNGNARFRHALQARLEVMRPTYDQLEAYANETKPKPLRLYIRCKTSREQTLLENDVCRSFEYEPLTPGIRQLIIALHKRGTDVYLVSGGFRRLIYPVADILGIDRKRIYANEILFDKNKNYAGFDENEPTSDSGSKDVGKPAVMGLLKKQGYKHVVMVGDGATDLEASPPADAFIGFGGNQIREAVRARADWYVTDFDVLRKALE